MYSFDSGLVELSQGHPTTEYHECPRLFLFVVKCSLQCYTSSFSESEAFQRSASVRMCHGNFMAVEISRWLFRLAYIVEFVHPTKFGTKIGTSKR